MEEGYASCVIGNSLTFTFDDLKACFRIGVMILISGTRKSPKTAEEYEYEI